MSSSDTDLVRIISEGGIAAKHAAFAEQPALVGPATADEHNTIKAGIIPIACWRVEDFRFTFDSSVVNPEIGNELALLQGLIQDHPPTSKSEGTPGCPLSVFGHADPTGDDEYNKQLSGRRASAIYGLLTRDANLWEKLFSQPFGNDKWGRKALEMMLDFVSTAKDETGAVRQPTPGTASADEVSQHERDAARRKQLFERYMDKLCGAELKLKKSDFLGGGQDAGGKADFQGCSEFNPVLIFSQKDQADFERSKDKRARDDANASNRRVVVLIFRKGSSVTPSKWPCPRATEGTAACRKRFWSDGEQRRSRRLPDQPRKFEETKDTFGCRFYQRLTDSSPCERSRRNFDIRLYDPEGLVIRDAPCVITVGSRTPVKTKARDGFVHLQDVEVPANCLLEWGFPPKEGEEPEMSFRLELFLDIKDNDADRDQEAARRLHNLGYPESFSLQQNVTQFQRDFGQSLRPPLRTDGLLDDATFQHLRKVYKGRADDLGQQRS